MTDQGATQDGTRFPPGAQILVRDEEWLVRNTTTTDHDGERIEAVGVSEFVRDEEAVFFSGIDRVELLDPEKTRLVPDTSSYFRRSRLFLEAVLRKTPLPQSERGLALADRFLLDPLVYQQRPAELALSMRNLRPRVLIADVVGLGKTLEIGLTLAELIRRTPTEITQDGPRSDQGVHIGTMYRFKGLEYRCLIIAGVAEGLVPRASVDTWEHTDPSRHQRELHRARSLLFVAATRARDALAITWHGEPSRFLAPLLPSR